MVDGVGLNGHPLILHLAKLIPTISLLADMAGDHEESGHEMVGPKDGEGHGIIVLITIVEGEDHRFGGQGA